MIYVSLLNPNSKREIYNLLMSKYDELLGSYIEWVEVSVSDALYLEFRKFRAPK